MPSKPAPKPTLMTASTMTPVEFVAVEGARLIERAAVSNANVDGRASWPALLRR